MQQKKEISIRFWSYDHSDDLNLSSMYCRKTFALSQNGYILEEDVLSKFIPIPRKGLCVITLQDGTERKCQKYELKTLIFQPYQKTIDGLSLYMTEERYDVKEFAKLPQKGKLVLKDCNTKEQICTMFLEKVGSPHRIHSDIEEDVGYYYLYYPSKLVF